MIDDDLKLLVDFRAEVPMPDREAAQRIYRVAIAAKPRRQPWLLTRLGGRPRLAVVVVLVAVVFVPTALAFGSKIVDLFEGTPAPPAVSSSFTKFNQMADLATGSSWRAPFSA